MISTSAQEYRESREVDAEVRRWSIGSWRALGKALGTAIAIFSMFFFLDEKERKNQDAAISSPQSSRTLVLRHPARFH